MDVATASEEGSPLSDMNGQQLKLSAAASVVALWGISRARIQRFETARFRDVQDELEQLLEDSLGASTRPELADAWIEITKSSWWSSDFDSGSPLTSSEVAQLNVSGGLAYRVAQKLSNDELCRTAVQELLTALPDGQAQADLLAGLWLDELIEPHTDDASEMWPGLLDVEECVGNHALADTASAGDWDRYFEILDEEEVNLVNSWRPGGHSWSTPLHQAARLGTDEQVIKRLLDLGAWKELSDRDGRTALEIALFEGHGHLADLLAPRSRTSTELALHRCLQYHLADLLATIVDLPPQRYRVPQIAVLAELDKPMTFEIAKLGRKLVLELDGPELLVEDNRMVGDKESTVYLIDATGVVDSGPRRDPVWQAEGADAEQSREIDTDSQPAQNTIELADPSVPDVADSDPGRRPSSRSITSVMSDYGDAFFTVVPQDEIGQFMESPEAKTPGIAITCSDFTKGRRWEYVGICGSARDLLGSTPNNRQWTYLLYVTSIFRHRMSDTALVECLRQQASSGVGPDQNAGFLATHRSRLGERVVARWTAIATLAAENGVAPQRPGVREVESLPRQSPVGATPRYIQTGPKRETWESRKRYEPPIRLFLSHTRGKAFADWDGNSLVMKEGSTCSEISLRSMPRHVHRIREELLADGTLAQRKRHLILTRDYPFDKPSNAASIVTGTSVNGKLEWVDKWGKSINDYLEEQNVPR